ncbi:MAG: cell division protein FtsZ [Prevotella sp.]|nr:cell division protein FtsZ [Prevotella sp.]
MGEKSALLDFGPVEDLMQNIIQVIGVGGGGCNAVSRMFHEGIQGVAFAVCNTDSASLKHSPVPVKLQLGEGLGAGGRPEVGRSEAESSVDMIERLIDPQTKMVFVTATMGGGTGTGAAPVVARVAKERGLLTIGVVTIPFYFEHRRKIVKALKGVDELSRNVDALLIVNNEKLCDVYSNTQMSFKDALAEADNVLKNAVKGISELITISSAGNINLDFRDVETTMRNGGGAIMAIGRANGDHRVERAILDALDSPLLHGSDINHAKRILFNIYSSEAAPILVQEMEEISEFFDQLDPDIDVIWGTSTDDSLGEDAKVIILAADMSNDVARQDDTEEHDDEYYQELMNQLYQSSTNGGGKKQEPVSEPTFVVEEAKGPEPAVLEGDYKSPNSNVADYKSTTTESEVAESDENPTTAEDRDEPEAKGTLDRLKGWLRQKMKEVTE